MDIKNININELNEYKNNPRDNKDAIEQVAKSIEEFGFKVPIIVDEDYTIIAGHTRKLAAESLGFEDVPVVIASDLSDEQVKAFRIADNRVSEFSNWDWEILKSELEEIETEFTGFEDFFNKAKEEMEDLEEFESFDEDDIATEYRCPKCHYEWSGQPK